MLELFLRHGNLWPNMVYGRLMNSQKVLMEFLGTDTYDKIWSQALSGSIIIMTENYSNKLGYRFTMIANRNVEQRGILIHGNDSRIFRPNFSKGCLFPVIGIMSRESNIYKTLSRAEVRKKLGLSGKYAIRVRREKNA